MDSKAGSIRRDMTAIRRTRCSRPVAIALAEGVISSETSVFDYGCGHGGDVEFLKRRKIKTSGWDPSHQPDGKVMPADVVNLGYVLNVIEDQRERNETLKNAFELANKCLVVSVRVDKAIEHADDYEDGQITVKNTFQKIYTQTELRDYLTALLGKDPHVVGPGIAFVFKDENEDSRYAARRAFSRHLEYRTDLIDDFAKNATAKRFVETANKLGRLPTEDEFKNFDALLKKFGSVKRIQRLALHYVDESTIKGSRDQRKSDILLFLASLPLQRMAPPKLSDLPPGVQADVKSIWGSYASAQKEGREFLFLMGNSEAVNLTCMSSPVGKLLPDDLYVHSSAEDEIPALLRLLIFAAKRIVGELDYNIVKINRDGRALSFLSYPEFDTDPHPALSRSVRIYLPKTSYSVKTYADASNPPILHRKETFVSESYPLFAKFAALTRAEEKAGLLSASDIGRRVEWLDFLRINGKQLKGHKVVNVA